MNLVIAILTGDGDDDVEAAVRSFQTRHHLDVDGKVGPRSLEELNVPVASRIDQIRAHLERARWVFRDIADTYIIVDIAGFRLDLVEEGAVLGVEDRVECSGAGSANRVNSLRQTRSTSPIGPLRCLAMMISANPAN